MEGSLILHWYQWALLLLPAILVCLLTPFILLRKLAPRSPLPVLPPGPRPLPIIGHLHLLGTKPHRSLHDLSNTYGPLMSLTLGSVRVIVASSASTAKQILQTHDQNFAFRALTATSMELHGGTNIVLSQPGPYLKLMRQLCVTDLVSSKRLESFRSLIEEEVKLLLSSIFEDHNMKAGVTLRPKLHETTNNIICRMTLGKRVSEVARNSTYDFVETMVEAIDLLGAINVSDYFPFLAWMDLQGYGRRMKVVSMKLHKIIQEIIDERRRRNDGNNVNTDVDFLDVLLSAAKSQRESMDIPDLCIRAVLWDVFAGGTDTSVVTTECALAELFANPKNLARVQQELEDVIGNSRLVEIEDLPKLPYLQAVVKETMRLHPVVPFLVPHRANQSCEVLGFHIPQNSQVYINTWAIGRDPSTWPNPSQFSPERFLNSHVDVHGHHFELLPFGSGRRICPGWPLGLLNVQFMLASLLHTFDWTTSSEPDFSELFGIIMTLATPLVATPRPRLSQELFNT